MKFKLIVYVGFVLAAVNMFGAGAVALANGEPTWGIALSLPLLAYIGIDLYSDVKKILS